MKQQFMSIVNWIGGLSCIGILCGFFMPFVHFEFWGQESEAYSLLEYFIEVCSGKIGEVARTFGLEEATDIFVLMNFGVLLTFCIAVCALISFSPEASVGTAIFLAISAIVGKLLTADISAAIFSGSLTEKQVGASVLEWSYNGLVVAGILAFWFSVIMTACEAFFSTGEKISKCPQCGKPFSKEDSFCGGCGHPLGGSVCPKCGKQGGRGEAFCKHCGEKLFIVASKEIAYEETEEIEEIRKTEQSENSGVQEGNSIKEVKQEELEEYLICVNCGHKNPARARFCPKCGINTKIKV